MNRQAIFYASLVHGYDAWRLSGPDESDFGIGEYEGETCNRLSEPDEDAPRGYRPRPCGGVMGAQDGEIVCESCGSLA